MTVETMMELKIHDGSEPFSVSVHEAPGSPLVVLFAVGAGGLPQRHATLLAALAAAGHVIIAPHFEPLASSFPAEGELVLRARRLRLALDAFSPAGVPVAGVGHSMGAATLVALAGGQMWLGPGKRVPIVPDGRLVRLALMAPPAGFFMAPGALHAVHAPVRVWVGSEDAITPPAQAQCISTDVHTVEGAGHFSFMDQPPPHAREPLQDRPAFLRQHSMDVCRFVADGLDQH